MKRLNKIFRLIFPSIIILAIILLAFFIYADVGLATSINDTGLKATADEGFKGGSGIPFENLKDNPGLIIGQIVGALLAFIGVIFFVLMIYGGFLWMTARGNEQQVEKAKDLLVAAVIGIIIIFAAYAITYYIGQIFGQTSATT